MRRASGQCRGGGLFLRAGRQESRFRALEPGRCGARRQGAGGSRLPRHGGDRRTRAAGILARPMSAEAVPADAAGVVFLSRRCCLHRDTLAAMTRALEAGADIVYGDSDRIDLKGRRGLPRFNPDFSPDLLYHRDYVSECVGISLRAWDGQWRFDDPYASLLRLVGAATRVEHLAHGSESCAPRRARERAGTTAAGAGAPVADAPRRRGQGRGDRFRVAVPLRNRGGGARFGGDPDARPGGPARALRGQPIREKSRWRV